MGVGWAPIGKEEPPEEALTKVNEPHDLRLTELRDLYDDAADLTADFYDSPPERPVMLVRAARAPCATQPASP